MLDRILGIDAAQHRLAGMLWAETPPDIRILVSSLGSATTAPPLRSVKNSQLVAMQAGYLYRDPPLLIIGGPAVADVSLGRLGVDVAEALAWLKQHSTITLDRKEASAPVGVGERLFESAIGSNVRRALTGAATRQSFTNAHSNTFARREGLVQTPMRVPDAIVLHADPVPQRITLTLEPTTACNFECHFCYGRHLPQGLLRVGNVEKLIDNLPEIVAVEITGEGEPLVNKDIFQIVAMFKRRGIWVHLTTNGSRLDDAMVARILDSGVDRIATSLESVNPKRYEALRPGGDFEDFRNGLLRFREASARRAQSPEMHLWISLLRECVDEINDMFAFADQIGFDRVEMQLLNAMQPYVHIYDDPMRNNLLTIDELRRLSNSPALSARAQTGLRELVSVYDGAHCAIYDSAAMVYWQGRITPCRLLKLPDVPQMGSLISTPFEELWIGADFQRFRFALRHGIVLKSCSGCAYVHAAEYSDRLSISSPDT